MRRFAILLAACGNAAPPCEVNADCPAGLVCSADHACLAIDAPLGLDAAGDAPACHPNHDGTIERSELVILVPARVSFRTSGETPIDLTGPHWDFSGALAGDRDVAVETAPVAGAWFAAKFPSGQFTTPLAGGGDLLGVYDAATENTVAILGAASPMAGLSQTELVYSPAVHAFELPLHVGQHWGGTSSVTGTAQGVPALFTDTYTTDVDASGDVTTPYGTFPVLRLKLVLRHQIGLATTTTVTYAFVAECFGTIAAVTGKPNDTTLATVAEVRRLVP
jgi:hypothetical protein